MSKLHKQIQEITKFLLDNSALDHEDLYRQLVEDRDPQLECFRRRRIDNQSMRVIVEEIPQASFDRIVDFMEKIDLINAKPLEVTSPNKRTLAVYKAETFNNLLEVLLKDFLNSYNIGLNFLKKQVINEIEYPQLRNATTIHALLYTKLKNPPKKIGLQDLNKSLTLLADLDLLQRKSPVLFL